MAAEAERELGRLEELLRRAGGERLGVAFFPIVFGVVRAGPAEGDAPELERVVMLNPITHGMVIFQGEPSLLSELLPARLAAGGGPPPASKASIEAMRAVDPGEEAVDEECPVCLEGLRSGSGETVPEEEEEEGAASAVVKEMPCRHRFHGRCIEKWLGMHGSCPVCRYWMPAEEEAPKKVGDASGAEGAEMGRARELFVTIAFGRRNGGADERQQQQEGGERHHQQQQQQQQEQEQQMQRQEQEQEQQGQRQEQEQQGQREGAEMDANAMEGID